MSKKLSQPTLSVIVTVHKEGIIAHKTVLSLLNGLDLFEKAGESYEIVIHIDNGSDETNSYFKRYENDSRFRILRNSFGNPADSRNFAVKHALGKYSAIIDGDDLITQNWFVDSLNIIKKHKTPVILRPNYQLQFGGPDPRHNIWIMEDSFSKEEDALIMSYYNRWPNVLFTTTGLLKKFPFKPTINGFGYEDWLFNCDIRAANIPNKIVPGATLFYRRRPNSVTSEHAGTILPYTPLFDIDFIKSLEVAPIHHKPESTASKVIKGSKTIAIKTINQVPFVRRAVGPIAYKVLYKKQLDKLPKDVLDAWKYLNTIDSQTWPTKDAVSGVRYHPLSFDQHNVLHGSFYKALVDQVSEKPDYIFLVPQLSTGGTEKLLLNYISAITKAHPDWHIAVLSALPKEHPYTFPANVDFIDFDGITASLEWYEKDVLWSRLLVQLGTKRLHIINHEGWYRWVTAHLKLLTNNDFIINAAMFMREHAHEHGRTRTFAEPYLSDAYPAINSVFTDNQNIINEMIEMNAFDPKKLIVHYQPASMTIKKPKDISVSETKPLRILWASRLSHQKRPDILKKIAEKLDPEKFHIDIYGREQHYTKSFFENVKSATYKGSFSGIESIPTDKYDVYLYTSSVDGLPNILLEISSLGLPIIASNDGGVGEFVINRKTGLLCEIETVDEYIQALDYIRLNPNKATAFAKASQLLLQNQHSVEQFEQKIARDIN